MEEKEKKLYDNLIELKKIKKDKDICDFLGIHMGTLKRWNLLKKVPYQYYYSINKMMGKNINLKSLSFSEKDQFFTTKENAELTSKKAFDYFENNNIDINNYTFIEPSAGDGIFIPFLKNKNVVFEAFDIEPRNGDIVEKDFLDFAPDKNKKYIVIGNPPFGLRGNLALKFINKSSSFADYVCFILPQLFESDGKGSPMLRVDKSYKLLLSEKIPNAFRFPDNKDVSINCYFQIWGKYGNDIRSSISEEIYKNIFKIYSLSNGASPSEQRNVKMIGKCDIYIPSTCFGIENMIPQKNFLNLPNNRGYGIVFLKDKLKFLNYFNDIKEFQNFSFKSTNGAFNIRKNEIIKFLYNKNGGF